MVWEGRVVVRSQQGQQEGVGLLLREEPGGHHGARPELVRGEGEVPDEVLAAPGARAAVLHPAGEAGDQVQLGGDM